MSKKITSLEKVLNLINKICLELSLSSNAYSYLWWEASQLRDKIENKINENKTS
jgi:hypothetical protein